jgi:hypothetical protein
LLCFLHLRNLTMRCSVRSDGAGCALQKPDQIMVGHGLRPSESCVGGPQTCRLAFGDVVLGPAWRGTSGSGRLCWHSLSGWVAVVAASGQCCRVRVIPSPWGHKLRTRIGCRSGALRWFGKTGRRGQEGDKSWLGTSCSRRSSTQEDRRLALGRLDS